MQSASGNMESIMGGKTNHQRKRYAAEHKFARVAAYNGLIDLGSDLAKDGRRAKKEMAATWTRRGGGNVTGFYNPKNAGAHPALVRLARQLKAAK